MKLSDYFKCKPDWEHELNPDNVLDKIAFVFIMKNDPNANVYFKLKEPLQDDHNCGMDCFQFEFDSDHGIYLHDGDMRFNDHMGDRIIDSSVNVIGFLRTHLISKSLSKLIL